MSFANSKKEIFFFLSRVNEICVFNNVKIGGIRERLRGVINFQSHNQLEFNQNSKLCLHNAGYNLIKTLHYAHILPVNLQLKPNTLIMAT